MRIQRPKAATETGLSRDIVSPFFFLCLLVPLGLHLLGRIIFLSEETGDRFTWVSVVLSVGMCGLAADRFHSMEGTSNTLSGALSAAASVILVVSLARLEELPNSANRGWWGFGVAGAVCFLLCSLLLYKWHLYNIKTRAAETVTVNKSSPTQVRGLALLGITACASVFFYGAFFIQPSWGVVDRYHSRYVINEIVGPLAGNWGLGSHIPQYTSGLGIPLLIFRPFDLTTAQTYAVATAYISGLAVLSALLIFLLSWKITPPVVRPVLPFFTLGLALVTQAHPIEHHGPITTLMSAVPGRMLPILLVLSCLIYFGQYGSLRSACLLGVAVGFCFINNFEFGVSTALSTLLGIMVLRTSLRHLVIVAIAVVLAVGSYLAMVVLDGNSVNLGSWFLFSLGFWSGFLGIPIPRFGVWLPVLAVFAFAAVLAIRRIRLIRLGAAEDSLPLLPVYLLVLVASSNGLMQFGYYAGRSTNSGQLQILLIYLALVSAGLSHELFRPGRGSPGSRWVFAMIVALPALALPSTRWPLSEWQRVTGHSRSVILESEDTGLMRESDLIDHLLDGRDRDSFALLLDGSNIHSIGSGLMSLAPTNSPGDLATSDQIKDRICAAIENERRFVITTTRSGLNQVSPAWCGAFPITAGVPTGLVVLSNLTSELP